MSPLEAPQPAQGTQRIKVIAFVKKRLDISREEFVQRWTEDHARLSRQLGASPYRVNIAAEAQFGDAPPPYDGTAEMYWPSRAAFQAALDSPAGALAGADTARFAASVELGIFDEWLLQ